MKKKQLKIMDLSFKDGSFEATNPDVKFLLTGGHTADSMLRGVADTKTAQQLNDYRKAKTTGNIVKIGSAVGGAVLNAFVPGAGTAVSAIGSEIADGITESKIPGDPRARAKGLGETNTMDTIADASKMAPALVDAISSASLGDDGMKDKDLKEINSDDPTSGIPSPTASPLVEPDTQFAKYGKLLKNVNYKKQGGFVEFKGAKHFENGMPGINMTEPGGEPTYVEDGETMFNGFVFTDSRFVPPEVIKSYGFGKKNNWSWARLSKELNKEYAARPNDPRSKAAHDEMMAKLAQQHMEYVPESRPENQGVSGINSTMQGGAYARYGGQIKMLKDGGGDPPVTQDILNAALDEHAATYGGARIAPGVQHNDLGFKAFVGLWDILNESGIDPSGLTITSLRRDKNNKHYKEGSDHNDANAIDFGLNSPSKSNRALLDYLKSDEGRALMKEHNVYFHEDGKHFHIGFRNEGRWGSYGNDVSNRVKKLQASMQDKFQEFRADDSEYIKVNDEFFNEFSKMKVVVPDDQTDQTRPPRGTHGGGYGSKGVPRPGQTETTNGAKPLYIPADETDTSDETSTDDNSTTDETSTTTKTSTSDNPQLSYASREDSERFKTHRKKAEALRNAAIAFSAADAVRSYATSPQTMNPMGYNVTNRDRIRKMSIDPIISEIDRQVKTGLEKAKAVSGGNANTTLANMRAIIGEGAKAASQAAMTKQQWDANEENRWADNELKTSMFNSQMALQVEDRNQANIAAVAADRADSTNAFATNLHNLGLQRVRETMIKEGFPYGSFGEFTGSDWLLRAHDAKEDAANATTRSNVTPRTKK